jgi:hypothetical protein
MRLPSPMLWRFRYHHLQAQVAAGPESAGPSSKGSGARSSRSRSQRNMSNSVNANAARNSPQRCGQQAEVRLDGGRGSPASECAPPFNSEPLPLSSEYVHLPAGAAHQRAAMQQQVQEQLQPVSGGIDPALMLCSNVDSFDSRDNSCHSGPGDLQQQHQHPQHELVRQLESSSSSSPAREHPQGSPMIRLPSLTVRRAQPGTQEPSESAQLHAELQSSMLRQRQLEEQVRQLEADPAALRQVPVSGLRAIEGRLEQALRRTREAVISQTISEAQRRVALEQAQCSLCLERQRGVVFNCGHQCCRDCSGALSCCPFCRVPIEAKIVLYHA